MMVASKSHITFVSDVTFPSFSPEDTKRKLNVHQTFNLRPVSTGSGISECFYFKFSCNMQCCKSEKKTLLAMLYCQQYLENLSNHSHNLLDVKILRPEVPFGLCVNIFVL